MVNRLIYKGLHGHYRVLLGNGKGSVVLVDMNHAMNLRAKITKIKQLFKKIFK
jgi:hypothetical protein